MSKHHFLHRWLSGGLGFVALLAMAACTQAEPQTAAPAQTGEPAELRQRIGTLPPQDLADGHCGMFLWARGSRANLVLFTSDRDDRARIVLDGEEVALPRTVADGDLVFGQYTRQQFASDTLNLRLTVRPDERSRMIGGTVLRQGTLSIEDKGGWNLILPVAGMIACKSR